MKRFPHFSHNHSFSKPAKTRAKSINFLGAKVCRLLRLLRADLENRGPSDQALKEEIKNTMVFMVEVDSKYL